jgi:SAM-dependent methyltransferase
VKLFDLVHGGPPALWGENEKIPWNEPEFSERMLREHLSQAHDAASRRAEIIDQHVDWIHDELLRSRPSRVLDLGCGPGLYTSRLARVGHTCLGIDFSPASIAHAEREAVGQGLACRYREADIRDGGYGEGFDLAMLVFGELNAFRREDAARILTAARGALLDGGTLLLEVHRRESLELDTVERSWYAAESGLFGDGPHVCLKESSWHAAGRARVDRWFVAYVSGEVARYGVTAQAYEPDEYRELLRQAGFASAETRPALAPGTENDDLCVWIAR